MIDGASYERELVEEVERFLQTAEGPSALYAVREVRSDRRRELPRKYFTKTGARAVAVSSGVGSEGDLAHLIRDIVREQTCVLDHPGIPVLREQQVRNIVLVNDLIESGTQICKFIESFDDKSIRSWKSSGHIRFTVIVHSATQQGVRIVQKTKFRPEVRFARPIESLRARLNKVDADSITGLCRTYGAENGIPPKWHLGYQKTFSNTVLPHKCPNTVPGILWYSYEGNGKPLFRQRGSLTFPVWPTAVTPVAQLRRVFTRANQIRLSKLDWLRDLGPSAPNKLAILSLVSRGIRRKIAFAESLQLPLHRIDVLVDEMVRLGWITTGCRLTDAGRALLQRAKVLGTARTEMVFTDPDDFFYL